MVQGRGCISRIGCGSRTPSTRALKLQRRFAALLLFYFCRFWVEGFIFRVMCGHRYAQYARSKLCNVLHALDLQRRFAALCLVYSGLG